MSAVVLVLPLAPDVVAAVRERELETGLEAHFGRSGTVARLEPRRCPIADASTTNPNDPNGPRAA